MLLSRFFFAVLSCSFFIAIETVKQIGCSDYFTTGNTIAKRISRQMEENLISETSGLNFEWWCIWERQPNYRYVYTKKFHAVENMFI